MDTPDYKTWFDGYADALTRSLSGDVEVERIRGFYAETVLALAQNGSVVPATPSDQAFATMLKTMYGFYAAIGTRRMTVDRVEVDALAPGHDRVRVFFRGEYRKPDGGPLTIPFDVLYLTQRRETGPVVFAFFAGDEMALFRKHGLVDEKGEPVAA